MTALNFLLLVCVLLSGCAEVTRPTPTPPEVETAQVTALTRHPRSTYNEERTMRVFVRLLATLPQIHGRTYPFLGFNWYVTEAGHAVVDNVWHPSPAHDRPLRQPASHLFAQPGSALAKPDAKPALQPGDLILAVNGMPLPTWVKEWDKLEGSLRQMFRYSLTGEVLVNLVQTARSARHEAAGIYRGGAVTLLLDRQGLQKQVTLYPIHLPAEYGLMIVTGRAGAAYNAFAAPGQIMITKQLLDVCRTDDELAIVLGHELAHHAHGHLVRKEGGYAAGGVVGEVLGVFLRLIPWPVQKPYQPLDEDIRRVAQNAMFSVYNRQDEREADTYGLWYAHQAGYDTHQGIYVWERLAAVAERDIFASTYFLSSHPPALERLARLKLTAQLFQEGKAAQVLVD